MDNGKRHAEVTIETGEAPASRPMDPPSPINPVIGAQRGRVTAIDDAGSAYVDFPAGAGPVAATVAAPWPGGALVTAVGRPVVLVFEGGDPARPIIVGWPDLDTEPTASQSPRHVQVDGRTVVVEAAQRLELRCGKASIVLTEDGKILLKGENLLNEARRLNKIRGAAVRIN